MKKHLKILLLLSSLITICQNKINSQTLTEVNKQIGKILKEDRDKIEILIVGSSHFRYPGADAHKTADSLKVDVLSPLRQKEIVEVIELLNKFQPTKIAVEWRSQEATDSLYRLFKNGGLKTERDEKVQLGFRLANNLNHARVYAVDALLMKSLVNPEIRSKYANVYKQRQKQYDSTYKKFNDFKDSLSRVMTIKDYFLFEAHESNMQRGHSQYLLYNSIGNKDEYVGADAFITQWYNRNLRIVSNIQRIGSPGDRILVLFGAGHAYLLNQFFQSDLNYRVRKLNEFLK